MSALWSALTASLRLYRERRDRKAIAADYMTRWRDFNELETPWIHPAQVPPLKPLKARVERFSERLAADRQRQG